MDNTLRKSLWGFLRPLVQLLTNLLSPTKGEEWEREFKKFLRREPSWVVPSFELYCAPQQFDDDFTFRELEEHLKNEGLFDRCLTLESPIVKGWLTDSSTYPDRLKNLEPVLFGSTKTWPSGRQVKTLCWFEHSNHLSWGGRWFDNNSAHRGYFPVLLSSLRPR